VLNKIILNEGSGSFEKCPDQNFKDCRVDCDIHFFASGSGNCGNPDSCRAEQDRTESGYIPGREDQDGGAP
jgi:hypothetical protein